MVRASNLRHTNFSRRVGACRVVISLLSNIDLVFTHIQVHIHMHIHINNIYIYVYVYIYIDIYRGIYFLLLYVYVYVYMDIYICISTPEVCNQGVHVLMNACRKGQSVASAERRSCVQSAPEWQVHVQGTGQQCRVGTGSRPLELPKLPERPATIC